MFPTYLRNGTGADLTAVSQAACFPAPLPSCPAGSPPAGARRADEAGRARGCKPGMARLRIGGQSDNIYRFRTENKMVRADEPNNPGQI